MNELNKKHSIPKLTKKLRLSTPAIVSYTTAAALFLDPRTIFPDTDTSVKFSLKNAIE